MWRAFVDSAPDMASVWLVDPIERVRDAVLQGNLWSAGELIQSRLYDLTVRPLSVWDMDKVGRRRLTL
jgi:hypothetical protein